MIYTVRILALMACTGLVALPVSAGEEANGTSYQSTLKQDTKTFRVAKKNFHWRYEEIDKWSRVDTIYVDWWGDCEDFNFPFRVEIGGTVIKVQMLENGAYHAVLLKDEYVFDYEREWPIPAHTYQKHYGRFVEVMIFKHRKSLGKE